MINTRTIRREAGGYPADDGYLSKKDTANVNVYVPLVNSLTSVTISVGTQTPKNLEPSEPADIKSTGTLHINHIVGRMQLCVRGRSLANMLTRQHLCDQYIRV